VATEVKFCFQKVFANQYIIEQCPIPKPSSIQILLMSFQRAKSKKETHLLHVALAFFFVILHILKDVVDEMKLSIYPSILSSVASSVPSSIHGWHHIIILYNVKAEKLM
jgi:hypothetical protein